jgi:hypothetical protein
MPYADAKYPATLRPADPGMLAAAPALLAQLRIAAEWISGQGECLTVPSGIADATRVDRILHRRHVA